MVCCRAGHKLFPRSAESPVGLLVAGFAHFCRLPADLPPTPAVSSVTPAHSTASLNAFDIVVNEALYEMQDASLSILNRAGTPVGSYELQITATVAVEFLL